ncbi:CDC48 family AAA ATPase [Candidatus Woesearchaeota archaeon]|nr:CDC48 family AAA ATPase [Candidatus Woesearchaeota archaeon]
MAESVKLMVMEAQQEEVNEGIVRIDSETMRKLDVRAGDFVEIEGGRKTFGSVDRAYPADIGQSIIRMDNNIRKNAKTGIGELVTVSKAELQPAKTVTIAPAQEGVMIQADPNRFNLIGRAVTIGDIISPGKRRPKFSDNSPFNDVVFERFSFMGFGSLKFLVVETIPKKPVIISDSTILSLSPHAVKISEEQKAIEYAYEDIGGLEDEVKKVREMIELPLKHPEIFEKLGIEPPKGVLLHGPPGCGKTLLAKAVANESDTHFISINSPEIMSKFVGEAEKKLRELFEDAEKKAPSIIFIDEIDAISPKREESYGEVERRVVAQLLGLMDGLKSRGRVVVIAATNRPNSIDPALRRPGRFDREIEIGVPTKPGRLNILKIHTRTMPLEKDVNLEKLAEITHGFVGADLSALCKEAAMTVLRRILPDLNMKEEAAIAKEVLDKLIIKHDDFTDALKLVRPSAMREVFVEIPNVKWKDIGGLKDLKQNLIEMVEWPLKHAKEFKRMGIKPPKGILMYGPPGCGKTMLAKAVANESEANFILVKGPELLNKFVGESEKGVRKVFEKARQAAPTIIFFDEIDSIAPRRGRESDSSVTDRMMNQLLTEMDGLVELNDVIIIGATNRPDIVDPALLRPGRFDRVLLVSVPDREARLDILKIFTAKMPLAKNVSLDQLADLTDNYVGADIENLCKEAAIIALRESFNAKEITMTHFKKALEKAKSSITKEDLARYQSIEEEYLRTARGAAMRRDKDLDYMG